MVIPVRVMVSPLESVTVPLVPVPVLTRCYSDCSAENIDKIGRRYSAATDIEAGHGNIVLSRSRAVRDCQPTPKGNRERVAGSRGECRSSSEDARLLPMLNTSLELLPMVVNSV